MGVRTVCTGRSGHARPEAADQHLLRPDPAPLFINLYFSFSYLCTIRHLCVYDEHSVLGGQAFPAQMSTSLIVKSLESMKNNSRLGLLVCLCSIPRSGEVDLS